MTISVARQAAKGVAWNMGTGVTVRALGLIGTLVLTRFIAPAEYGEVSAALICVLTATRLFTFGLGPYVIAHRADAGVTFQALVCHMIAIAVACCTRVHCMTVPSITAMPIAVTTNQMALCRATPTIPMPCMNLTAST